jgi:tetraacyldisaccharide 4'-kinase
LVDSDRVAAARAAMSAGCDVLVADDGLQHRRLARDMEIEVVDGQRGYGNGLLLPAGPLREAPRACDLRVVNGGAPVPGSHAMAIRCGDAQALDAAGSVASLASFRGRPVTAVAGIANPGRFFEALHATGLDLVERAFPDHHAFVARDFSGIRGPILMTAKDAVKCRSLGLVDAWVVPAQAVLPEAFYAAIDERLDSRHAAT